MIYVYDSTNANKLGQAVIIRPDDGFEERNVFRQSDFFIVKIDSIAYFVTMIIDVPKNHKLCHRHHVSTVRIIKKKAMKKESFKLFTRPVTPVTAHVHNNK